jgi:2-succinyl-6-hydroxy-2,4-cyclohexadiene-1-carboxylate synthase
MSARLHAEVRGSGPPLVLLHGFTGCTAAWDEVAPALALRCTTIALDLPGHGRSRLPADGTAGLEAAADAAVETVRVLGFERSAWLGYSLGGRVALHIALRHPARVARLILESCSPGIEDPDERATRAAADEAQAQEIVVGGVAAFADAWAAQPLFRSQERLSRAVRERQREMRRSASPEGLAAALRALGVGRQAWLLPRLRDIAAPTLLVAGALDDKYRSLSLAMEQELGAGCAVIVPDAGHTVHLEQPALFVCAVLDFLGAEEGLGRAEIEPGRARPATQRGQLR